MELQTNGAAVNNGTTQEIVNHSVQNDIKKDTTKSRSANGKADTPAPAKPESKPQTVAEKPTKPEPVKQALSLDAKLKMVSDLHRRSVQRLNLISRIHQLEAFEIALAQQNDELEDNPYQGCKLIIRDDSNREFVTTTPGLIRLVSQFIFSACNEKLSEIEATINFPTA